MSLECPLGCPGIQFASGWLMNCLFPVFAGLCLVLSACSSSGTDASGTTTPAGGSAGSTDTGTGGGSLGGAPGTAGATDGAAGLSTTAGASATGGSGAGGGSGGTSASAGAGGAAPSGGGAGQSGGASSQIDFSIWSLQLPTGTGTSPTTISPAKLAQGYMDAYFYPAADGGQTFMDPATGITTSGSVHCRTEMRESTADGSQAAWASTGTNTMTVTGKVLKVGGGSSGDVTVGQLFNGTDSIPLIEMQYSVGKGGFELLYEEAKGGGSETDLKTPVALNTQYTFSLALSKGVATVSVNGTQVYTHTPSAGTLAKSFYFKFGNYDQTAMAGAISTTPYTVVEAYSVAVVHN